MAFVRMLSVLPLGDDLRVFTRDTRGASVGEVLLASIEVVQAVLAREVLTVPIGEACIVFAREVLAVSAGEVRLVFAREVLAVSIGEARLVFARVFRLLLTGEVLRVFNRVFARVLRAVVSRDVQLLLGFGGFGGLSCSAAFLFANSSSIVFSTAGTPSVRGQARSNFVTSFSLSGSSWGVFLPGSRLAVCGA